MSDADSLTVCSGGWRLPAQHQGDYCPDVVLSLSSTCPQYVIESPYLDVMLLSYFPCIGMG
jgi:hypothetical protein